MNPRLIMLVGLIPVLGVGGKFPAGATDVVLVKGDLTKDHNPREAGSVDRYYETVATALRGAGIPFAEVNDTQASEGHLSGYKLAIFPYNAHLSDAEIEAIQDFVLEGGRLIVFYSLHPSVASLLGIKRSEYQAEEYAGQFASIRFTSDAVAGLPPVVEQNSWNILAVDPSGDTTVLGEWYDARGQPTGYPAWTLNSEGAYMSHVLLPGDREAKQGMLVAIVGHFVPGVWVQASERALAHLGQVGEFSNLEDLTRALRRLRRGNPHRKDISFHLRAARWAQRLAEARIQQGRYAEAVRAAQAGRESAALAYIFAQPSRDNELRGVWIHTAYGVEARDWDWQRSIFELKMNGFNAIFPNMQWAGRAHHESRFLPEDPRVKEGDPLWECALWCRRYGVECHVWKVNFNLSTAPPEWVQELRQQGRTQVSVEGQPVDWLCPSHPANIGLETQSLLEVVRRYKVDGIHLGYIRYPNHTCCYCEGCRERFNQAALTPAEKWPDDVLEGGPAYEEFQNWRRNQITRLVERISRKARQIKPHIKISAAVFGDWESARKSVGQDWKLWIDKGYLDFVCPMDYTTDEAQLERLVARQVRWVNGQVPLYIGLGAWRLGDTPAVADRIKRARKLGADGFVLFHYNDPEIAGERLPQLHYRQTANEVTQPHKAPLVEFDLPPGLSSDKPFTYPAGTQLTFEARLRPKDTPGADISFAQGTVSLQTLQGRTVQRFGEMSVYSRGRQEFQTRTLQPGTYRLVWEGRVRNGPQASQPNIDRGPLITILPEPAQ